MRSIDSTEMPAQSQPRVIRRPLSRPSQPPPPPPPIKAPKPEVSIKDCITGDGSADVADALKGSGMLNEDKNFRPPSSQKQNLPQPDHSSSSSTKMKGSGFPRTRKPAPPVPTKPAHLVRKCLTPPPKPGNLYSVLGLSSYSLPEYELSDLEHPQLSSTLKSQVLPKPQIEAAKSEPEPKPPQVPVRRDSMKKINSMMLRESKTSSTSMPTITSMEESFITRFRPAGDFPAPEVFRGCEKTYPSREQESVARSECDQVATAIVVSESGSDPSPPPLPSTAPPTRSIGDGNIIEQSPVITPNQAQPTVPPPLPVENDNISAVSSEASIIPPPPPLPCPDTCPVPVHASSAAKPGVQASTPTDKSNEQPMTCTSEAVDDSPISVTRFVKSGFADNLAKLYGATKRTETCLCDEPPSLAAKPRPPLPINRKPELVKSGGMKLPSLRMKQPAVTSLPSNTSSSSASSMLTISSSVSARRSNTSPALNPPRSAAPPPPPPAPSRTSSLSTSPPRDTTPEVHCDKSSQSLSRSLSVRSAPPPPVPAHSSGLDSSHSLRPSNTTSSSSPLDHSSESMTRKYSFRAAPPPPPPPPQSPKPTESLVSESSSQGSSRLSGHLQTHKLLIC